jgi:hypothetical protein
MMLLDERLVRELGNPRPEGKHWRGTCPYHNQDDCFTVRDFGGLLHVTDSRGDLDQVKAAVHKRGYDLIDEAPRAPTQPEIPGVVSSVIGRGAALDRATGTNADQSRRLRQARRQRKALWAQIVDSPTSISVCASPRP